MRDGMAAGTQPRFAFQWHRPRLVRVTAADDQGRLRILLNRYPGAVIGLAAYRHHRGLSLLWGRPGMPRR